MKALIIEDEQPAARQLQSIIREINDIQVIGVIESVSETIDWFKKNTQPDLIFLDIHLADGFAFEIFNHINIPCPIIFTTAYDEFALDAFKVNSIDYLLKPVDRQMVEKALKKLNTLSSTGKIQEEISRLLSAYSSRIKYRTHFLVPTRGSKYVPLLAKDIAYIYIDAGVIKARTNDEKTFILENTLDELTRELNPGNFFRANRQFIISKDSIKEVDLWFHSRLSIFMKIPVPEKILISKARVPEFKIWYGGER